MADGQGLLTATMRISHTQFVILKMWSQVLHAWNASTAWKRSMHMQRMPLMHWHLLHCCSIKHPYQLMCTMEIALQVVSQCLAMQWDCGCVAMRAHMLQSIDSRANLSLLLFEAVLIHSGCEGMKMSCTDAKLRVACLLGLCSASSALMNRVRSTSGL